MTWGRRQELPSAGGEAEVLPGYTRAACCHSNCWTKKVGSEGYLGGILNSLHSLHLTFHSSVISILRLLKYVLNQNASHHPHGLRPG